MEEPSGGPKLSAQAIRSARLELAREMLRRLARDVATLPVREQKLMRRAVTSVQQVQAWLKRHGAEEAGL